MWEDFPNCMNYDGALPGTNFNQIPGLTSASTCGLFFVEEKPGNILWLVTNFLKDGGNAIKKIRYKKVLDISPQYSRWKKN